MANLNEVLYEFDRSDKVEAEHKLSVRATKTIMRFFGMEPGSFARAPEFNIDWFQEQQPDFPIRLETRRVQLKPERIFLNMIKGKPWKLFTAVLEEHDFGRVGVIMSAYNQRLYVFHNWWNLPPVAGHTRMIRQATSGDSGVIFETLESLLHAIKAQGWSP